MSHYLLWWKSINVSDVTAASVVRTGKISKKAKFSFEMLVAYICTKLKSQNREYRDTVV